jgi:hypothetical protein
VKRGQALLLIPLALAVLVALAVARPTTAAQGSNYANDPFCQNLQGVINTVPSSKSVGLVRFCDNRAHDLANGGPPPIIPRTPSPFPTVAEGGPIYGIGPPNNEEPWDNGTHLFLNTWNGQNNIVFAGALYSDQSQGLVVLTDRGPNGPPGILGIYQSPSQDGALRVTAANGEVLTLVATDGATYAFNVSSPALVRQ